MTEVIFAGSGGQGVLTIGLIVAEIAICRGDNATWLPSYGSAMRGGTANCTVKFGKETVYNPAPEHCDMLLAMNQPSLDEFMGIVKKDGVMLINSDLVRYTAGMRKDVQLKKIPCSTMAQEINHPRGANVIMAGAVARASATISLAEGLDGMNALFRSKGKERFEAINSKAFEAGYTAIAGC